MEGTHKIHRQHEALPQATEERIPHGHGRLGWEQIELLSSNGIQEGASEACFFALVVFGEIITKLDSEINLGLSNDASMYLATPERNRAVGYVDDWTLMSESLGTLGFMTERFA